MKEENIKLEKQRNRARILNIILIIIIILLLLFWYILGYRLGKIGFWYKETGTKPNEEEPKQEKVVEIQVSQGDIDLTKGEQLDIFSNEKFNGEKKIAPGSKGSFEFCVKNITDDNIMYDIDFSHEMQLPVNMKYKLKIDNIYVKGNKENYTDIENLKVKDIAVLKDSTNLYTLEWYWEDDDTNDTIVGSNEITQYYKLNLDINAREYIE